MMTHVPAVLGPEALERCREILERAEWLDGRVTAGHQSARVKSNRQIPEGSAAGRALGALVLAALEQCPLFISAALPQRVFPPLFNRYQESMSFGSHVDNALRPVTGTSTRLRTDLSATLFLSDPETYQGGELVVEDTYGSHAVKLPAGDLILYPASSLHHVTAVTAGVRLASFFWVQSLVRDPGQRALLFELDMAVMSLNTRVADDPALVVLTGVYHNLLRRWAEP
jgi:PKHD-type hydroxylase